jgi:hypothetical protein
MEIFDSINLYLFNHPAMLDHLEFMIRIKFWLLLGLALFFMFLPYREQRKRRKKQVELSKKRDHFLA